MFILVHFRPFIRTILLNSDVYYFHILLFLNIDKVFLVFIFAIHFLHKSDLRPKESASNYAWLHHIVGKTDIGRAQTKIYDFIKHSI